MSKNKFLSVVVLGAGKGTRMKSNKAKVLHELFHAPMIHHVLGNVMPLCPLQVIVIVGHQRRAVVESLRGFGVETVVQQEQLGTGHAVLCTEQQISADCQTVLILCGDTPLIRSESLAEMVKDHEKSGATVTVMTTCLDDPTNYGRIICDGKDQVQAIVEEKDATDEQRQINEINGGIYCVKREFLFGALKRIGTDNSQGEVYLTDIVSLAVGDGFPVAKFLLSRSEDVLGVNSRVELAGAHKALQLRRNRELMAQGVSMDDPDSVNVQPGVTVGADTLLGAGIYISGASRIGDECRLDNGVILKDCRIGNGVRIGAYCYLDGVDLEDRAVLEPYTLNKKVA